MEERFCDLSVSICDNIINNTKNALELPRVMEQAEWHIFCITAEIVSRKYHMKRAEDLEKIMYEMDKCLTGINTIIEFKTFCEKNCDPELKECLLNDDFYDMFFKQDIKNIIPYNLAVVDAKKRLKMIIDLKEYCVVINYIYMDSNRNITNSIIEHISLSQTNTIHTLFYKILRKSIDNGGSMKDRWELKGSYPFETQNENEYTCQYDTLIMAHFEEAIALKTSELIYGIQDMQLCDLYEDYFDFNNILEFDIICIKAVEEE